jgi:hypothetical protein
MCNAMLGKANTAIGTSLGYLLVVGIVLMLVVNSLQNSHEFGILFNGCGISSPALNSQMVLIDNVVAQKSISPTGGGDIALGGTRGDGFGRWNKLEARLTGRFKHRVYYSSVSSRNCGIVNRSVSTISSFRFLKRIISRAIKYKFFPSREGYGNCPESTIGCIIADEMSEGARKSWISEITGAWFIFSSHAILTLTGLYELQKHSRFCQGRYFHADNPRRLSQEYHD